MNKKGFEFSFAWIFAIIVGAVILLIAIFATTNLIDVERTRSDTQVAAQLGIILNPLETSLESGRYAKISFPEETQFFNECSNLGSFGRQTIKTSLRSSLGAEEFQDPGVSVSLFNKYLFSDKVEQSEDLHVFVKPFEMPYKISDLMFVFSENHCFVNPPGDVQDEINALGIENINVTNTESLCPSSSKVVCFSKTGCDIDVNLQSQIVSKEGNELYYEEDLLYGAIFADPEIYECQIERLGKRLSEISHLYASKADFVDSKGCNNGLSPALRNLAGSAQIGEDENSLKLRQIKTVSDEIRRQNDLLTCEVF